MKRFFYCIVLVSLITATTAFLSKAEARAYGISVVEMQSDILDAGTQQAIHSITVARHLCLAAGGIWDPSRIRSRTRSKVESRVESRSRDRYRGYNTIHLDLNRVLFGQPRLPQDYTNEVEVEVDTDSACR